MEKISSIVRGSSRVASTDLKNSPAVRPGAPSYGRPVGETAPKVDRLSSTASRAVALHNEMIENKRTSRHTEVAAQMADQFFMNRLPRESLDEAISAPAPGVGAAPPKGIAPTVEALKTTALEPMAEDSLPPPGFTPRGSYVDVRA